MSAEMFSALTPDELKAFHAALLKILNNLSLNANNRVGFAHRDFIPKALAMKKS
jgi:hypothetical protein